MNWFRRVLLALTIASIVMGSESVLARTGGPAPGGCAPDELFMGLTSDEPWRASMALNFASRNLELGYPVTVFLNVEGVRLAVKDSRYRQDTYGLTGITAREVLMKLSDNGGRVIVCPSCLERSGFKRRDLINGVYLGGPVPEIFQCSSKQLSY